MEFQKVFVTNKLVLTGDNIFAENFNSMNPVLPVLLVGSERFGKNLGNFRLQYAFGYRKATVHLHMPNVTRLCGNTFFFRVYKYIFPDEGQNRCRQRLEEDPGSTRYQMQSGTYHALDFRYGLFFQYSPQQHQKQTYFCNVHSRMRKNSDKTMYVMQILPKYFTETARFKLCFCE